MHYNYVCALLNDLFGIQSRGGCQCSGPYSQKLLGLTELIDGQEVPNEANKRTEYALIHFKERAELLRPGYTRLSLPFKGVSSAEVDYVLRALEWVAKHKDISTFFKDLNKYPFFEDLESGEDASPSDILKSLLEANGLNYASKPKGLL